MTDNFQRNLAISGAIHFCVALLIFVRAVFIPTEPIDIRDAIRVDVVGLPEKMTEMPQLLPPKPPPEAAAKPEPAKPEPKPEVKPEPKPDQPTVNLDKKKKDKAKNLAKAQEEAMRKLKAQAALEKLNKELAKEKSDKPGTVIKGNQVAAGDSLTGIDKLDHDRYYSDIKVKVQSQFNIPQWLAESNLDAQVQLMIDERGYIIKKVIKKSSGNAVFDAKVIEALEASSPLPAPPRNLQSRLATVGIVLGFPK